MGRWEPGARSRLAKAALDLFLEQGFEQTTVAEIAGRAGLTERTFFRHFTDKREVLFGGEHVFEDAAVEAARGVPAGATPLATVEATFVALAETFFADRHAHSRRRQQVLDATTELQERELLKLARIADALAAELRDRGTAAPVAQLAAETGVALFKVAFARWVGSEQPSALADHIRAAFGELGAELRAG